MTEKHFIIKLTEEIVVKGTAGKITRNSNSTQFLDVELDGWKLNEGDVLYIELSHYNDDTELTTRVGPLQLFFKEELGRYITLAPPEFISVAGVWEYSIEQRFNISEDAEGQLKYNSITSAICTLTVIDSIMTVTGANSFTKEMELIAAAKVVQENYTAATGSVETVLKAAKEAKVSAETAVLSATSAGDSAARAGESERKADEYANAAQSNAESSAQSAKICALSVEESVLKAQEIKSTATTVAEDARIAQVAALEARDYANIVVAASSSGMRKVIVNSLPEEGSDNYIYLVLSNSTTEDNYYDEYLWIKDEKTSEAKYEKIGTTRTDLTADNIVLEEDITLAGNYVQVGNISKGSETATATFSAKGKTVAQVLEEIFTKRLQPQIVRQPSVYGFTFNRVGQSVEVGTQISSITVGTLNLEKGAYTYDTDTGIEAEGYSISRVINDIATEISEERSFIDTNDGEGFVVGDDTTIAYKGTIAYSQGSIANDNLGSPSGPPVRIEAGTATSSLSALTGYRNYFYGTTDSATPPQGDEITSEFVRGLIKSNAEYSARTFTITVPAGATGIYIVCIETKTGVAKVINKTALNADVTATFIKQENVAVEGANGYTAAGYNVWYYIPAAPYENSAELEITLG